MKDREEQLFYGLALSLVPNLGHIRAKHLIGYCGGTQEVFETPFALLKDVPGVGTVAARSIKNFKDFSRAEQELKFIKDKGFQALFYFDKNYPVRLKMCDDGPLILFAHHIQPLLKDKVISIVGTRNATEYGKRFVEELIDQLAAYNCTVVSGLAYGIDYEAHKACLKQGVDTVAVVAHGMDKVYPALHRETLAKMVEQGGGLVTEFFSETIPNRENFPIRNRIVAGVADATIVVESDTKGGSMITAELAHGYGRELFALPGSIYQKYSRGCNKLIKTQKAYVIESVSDLVYHLNWESPDNPVPVQKTLFNPETEEEKVVFAALGKETLTIDQLYLQTKIPLSKLSLLLLDLEFNGHLKALPGKKYRLL